MVHLPLGKIFAFQFCLAVRGDDGDVSKHLLQGSCGKIPVSLTKEMPMWLGLFFPTWDTDMVICVGMQQPPFSYKEQPKPTE